MQVQQFQNHGFIRVAVAVPDVKVADVGYNVGQTAALARKAAGRQVQLLVLPELGLTGYTTGDLVQQPQLLQRALAGLTDLAKLSRQMDIVLVVGLPLAVGSDLYNVAAVVADGKVVGIVPKSYLPTYGEFYEQRWYTSGRTASGTVPVNGTDVPFGTDLLFDLGGERVLGVEICEDLWAPVPPSSWQALAGATLIANLSASNELVGKMTYRRQLVSQQAARTRSAYLYASAGVTESTTDVVFSGHGLVTENGLILAESQRFSRQPQLIVTDVDIQHLLFDRRRAGTFQPDVAVTAPVFRRLPITLSQPRITRLERRLDPQPFVPADPAKRDEHAAEILQIQTAGLATRLQQTGISQLVLGLSGGLDSTLALLVAVRALRELNLPLGNLHAITMPGFATGKRTKDNAGKLAKALGVTLETVDITAGAKRQLTDVGHDQVTQDVTYENVQARYRTLTLFTRANQIGGTVVGTGDLSELALGWCTFNGDHMAHYNVNASVPKTLVRDLVDWVSRQPEFKAVRAVLQDILATPVSPELTGTPDELSQTTEELIGPYELHDFFLYHFVRWGSPPAKIRWLAKQAFADRYKPAEIDRWLKVFIERFFKNQWKRSVMPDGPKVGSVSLSPRGDWRMPSDAYGNLWME